jgi:hypothetical protein
MKKMKNLTEGRFEKIRQFLTTCRENPDTPSRDITKALGIGNQIFSSAVELGYIIPVSKSKKHFKGYNFSYVYVTDRMVENIINHERNKRQDRVEIKKTRNNTPASKLKLSTEINPAKNISKVHFSVEDLEEIVEDLKNQGYEIPAFDIFPPRKPIKIGQKSV